MHPTRSRGFTLIELLVVLVIVGILVSLAALTMSDNRAQEFEREARRLYTVIGLAVDEAALKAETLGIRFEDDGYHFARLDDERWVKVESDRFLRPHRLPDTMRLDVVLDGLAASGEAGEEQARDPQVIIMLSGEMIPFEATLRHAELQRYYLIEGHLDGALELQDSND
jgi:general secretion pathway protein H